MYKLHLDLLLDDLRVDGRHSIHLIGAHAGQVPHADLLHVSLLHDAQGADDGAVAVPAGPSFQAFSDLSSWIFA